MHGPQRIAVAWSGGRDSTALLHATLRASSGLGVEVVALHVHHGLSPHADEWQSFCEAQARRWQRRYRLVLRTARLGGSPARGESIEAWARLERYRALRRLALEEGARTVLLAHHRLDQAETVLLQALRGAGVAGLAGMPQRIQREDIEWVRPWLAHDPEAIAAYVRRHRLKHIEDDSNADRRFARNRLRMDVWPTLVTAFPQARTVLADVAEWARQASSCLTELANEDLETLAPDRALEVERWCRLSEPRRVNALRRWLSLNLGQIPSASLVERLADELPRRRQGRWPCGAGALRLYRGRLTHRVEDDAPRGDRERFLCVGRAGRYRLAGWRGVLVAERVKEGGVPVAWLAALELRERLGGEQFQAGIGRPPRSLKKQFQSLAVPAWDRDGPLVYSGGQLVFVPGLGLDARVIGLPGQPLLSLRWEPWAPR